MRCQFSPERILGPPLYALKMTFPHEGPLFSLAVSGSTSPKTNVVGTQPSGGNKLKEMCSTILEWDDDRFEEVEASTANMDQAASSHLSP
jgi:hypothetical protein